MRLHPLRSWGLWLTSVLFLPSLLSAQGVVVETVAPASALEKAGAREGDVFRAWARPANPPANPEPASGTLQSPFDWKWLEIEQAPRANDKAGDDLATIQRLACPGDDPALDQIKHAIGEHLRVDAQVTPVGKRREHRIGDRADA